MGVPDAFSYRDDPSVPPFPDDRPPFFEGRDLHAGIWD